MNVAEAVEQVKSVYSVLYTRVCGLAERSSSNQSAITALGCHSVINWQQHSAEAMQLRSSQCQVSAAAATKRQGMK